MNWIEALFMSESVAHSILLLALVIAAGLLLGKIKIAGVSLGVTWILFAGIIFSHFGMRLDSHTLHFVKEFGLILFVYSIGMQVGPGFFSSFKKGGITLNMLAALVVILGALTTYVIHLVTSTDLVTMIGIMSGAVTNTPGLGAAQQTYMDVMGVEADSIAAGYAIAYPLGVVGIIMTIIVVKKIFRVDVEAERKKVEEEANSIDSAIRIAVEVKNPALKGRTIYELDTLLDKKLVVSRLCNSEGCVVIPTSDTKLSMGDKLLIVTSSTNEDRVSTFIGEKVDMDQDLWNKLDVTLISRRILITKGEVNGKTLGELKIRSLYGLNITRINRAGVDLVALPTLPLLIGDRVTVVGSEKAISKVADLLGNSMQRLNEPNLITIFIGIALGVILGSIPIMFPGIPQPVKLGLAGGPLIVAILISKFGPKYGLVTYTTMSANLMLREIGISLFLAAVGLGAGETFISTLVGGGYWWILYGVIITVVPLIIVSTIARLVYKIDYFTLAGMLAGSTTDPPSLAYTNNTMNSPRPAFSYATVYPLTMFLRVLVAQVLMLIAL